MQPVGISHTDSCFFYQPSDPPSSISWEKQDEFLFRIESGEGEVVREMVEELFSYYLTLTPCTLWDVKCHCEQLTYHCHTVLNYYLKKTDDSWKASPNMQAIVNTLFSSDEVKAYYMQFFLNITSLLKKQSVYNTGELLIRFSFISSETIRKISLRNSSLPSFT